MAKTLILCDTDVLIDYLDENQVRHAKTKRIIEDQIFQSNLLISIITKMELLIGLKNKNEQSRFERHISRFTVLLLNDQISRIAYQLLKKYNLAHGLLLPDSLIASTAICTDIELFTYNVKDYRFIKQLKLYHPL
ncbi:MAG: type II toxin-antitoxin system VapC family toxin [Bacteroidales bacterium]